MSDFVPKLIYVAGPLRAKTRAEYIANAVRAWDVAREVWRMGHIAHCPHTNTFMMEGAGIGADEFIAGDLKVLDYHDAILLLPKWRESEGARREYLHAVARKMPVFNGLEGLAEKFGRRDTQVTLPSLTPAQRQIAENLGQDMAANKPLATAPGALRRSPTGAVRSSDAGRGWPSHLSPIFLDRVAKLCQAGGTTYGPRNWERGLKLSWIVDSLFRHLFEVMMGARLGKTASTCNPTAIAWNAMILVHTIDQIEKGALPAELDDLPSYTREPITHVTNPKDEVLVSGHPLLGDRVYISDCRCDRCATSRKAATKIRSALA